MFESFEPRVHDPAVRNRVAGGLFVAHALFYAPGGLGPPAVAWWLAVSLIDLVIGAALLGNLQALRRIVLSWLVIRMVVWLCFGVLMNTDRFVGAFLAVPVVAVSLCVLLVLCARSSWVASFAALGAGAVICLELLLALAMGANAH